MELIESHIITILVFLPVAGAIVLLLVNRRHELFIKNFAFGISLVTFLISLRLYWGFDKTSADMQFIERASWIPAYGINYFVGVDGISLWLVILTALLSPIAILASYNGITERVKEFYAFLLVLIGGMVGVFVALDLFLFYIFWEAMLIPMYFLIGIWGSTNKIYAAVKFFIYTMFGGVLMLVAIITLVLLYREQTGEFSFNLLTLQEALRLPLGIQTWLFLAFGIAFAIKVPMFPFHTWLPDAHVEAPTAGSVILAGVLLKMGTYGFLRFALPLFPDAALQFLPLVMVLAIVGIIYGALMALVQPDLKKLVAYSSVSHLGFVMLGIFALNAVGIEGAIILMISHGLSTGALFLIVGMIYERRHTRMIADFGGLWGVMPVFGTFFLIFTLASIGLPGTSGFVGEFLTLLGAFRVYIPYAVLGATGVILAAIYMLWMFQRVMQGEADKPENRALADLSPREIAVLVPLVLLVFWLGIYPKTFTDVMHRSVERVIAQVIDRDKLSEPVLVIRTSPKVGGEIWARLTSFVQQGVAPSQRGLPGANHNVPFGKRDQRRSLPPEASPDPSFVRRGNSLVGRNGIQPFIREGVARRPAWCGQDFPGSGRTSPVRAGVQLLPEREGRTRREVDPGVRGADPTKEQGRTAAESPGE